MALSDVISITPIFSTVTASESLGFKPDFKKLLALLNDPDLVYRDISTDPELSQVLSEIVSFESFEEGLLLGVESYRRQALAVLSRVEKLIQAGLDTKASPFLEFCEQLYDEAGYSSTDPALTWVEGFKEFQVAGNDKELLNRGLLYLSAEEKTYNLLFLVQALKFALVISVEDMQSLLSCVHNFNMAVLSRAALSTFQDPERNSLYLPIPMCERLYLNSHHFFAGDVVLIHCLRLSQAAGFMDRQVREDYRIPPVLRESMQGLVALTRQLLSNYSQSDKRKSAEGWLRENAESLNQVHSLLCNGDSLLTKIFSLESTVNVEELLEFGLSVALYAAPFLAPNELTQRLLGYYTDNLGASVSREATSGAGAGVSNSLSERKAGAGESPISEELSAGDGLSVLDRLSSLGRWVAKVSHLHTTYQESLSRLKEIAATEMQSKKAREDFLAARQAITEAVGRYRPDNIDLDRRVSGSLELFPVVVDPSAVTSSLILHDAIDTVSAARQRIQAFTEVWDEVYLAVEALNNRVLSSLAVSEDAGPIVQWEAEQWIRLSAKIGNCYALAQEVGRYSPLAVMDPLVASKVNELFTGFLVLRAIQRELELRVLCLKDPAVGRLSALQDLLKKEFPDAIFVWTEGQTISFLKLIAFFETRLAYFSQTILSGEEETQRLLLQTPPYDFHLFAEFFNIIRSINWESEADDLARKHVIQWFSEFFKECQRVLVTREPIEAGSLIQDWTALVAQQERERWIEETERERERERERREAEERKRETSAILIQSVVRMHLARKHFMRMVSALIALQAHRRGFIGRNQALIRKMEVANEKVEAANQALLSGAAARLDAEGHPLSDVVVATAGGAGAGADVDSLAQQPLAAVVSPEAVHHATPIAGRSLNDDDSEVPARDLDLLGAMRLLEGPAGETGLDNSGVGAPVSASVVASSTTSSTVAVSASATAVAAPGGVSTHAPLSMMFGSSSPPAHNAEGGQPEAGAPGGGKGKKRT